MLKIIKGDMWDVKGYDAICITTNGYVKSSGEAVMGRGNALQAKAIFKDLPKILGDKIKNNGNIVQYLNKKYKGSFLYSFPVKPKSGSSSGGIVEHLREGMENLSSVPGWAMKAQLSIIKRSAQQLINIIKNNKYNKVLLPFPGVGAGELNREDVLEVLEDILDDRVILIERG